MPAPEIQTTAEKNQGDQGPERLFHNFCGKDVDKGVDTPHMASLCGATNKMPTF